MNATQISAMKSQTAMSNEHAKITEGPDENISQDRPAPDKALVEPDLHQPSAASQTFNIVELFEQVLANLDLKNLTRARRVCRTWKILLEESTVLRRIRLLEPVEPREWVMRVPRVRSGIRMAKEAPEQGTEFWVPSALHPALHKSVTQNIIQCQFVLRISPPVKNLSCQIHIYCRSWFPPWVSKYKLHEALICQPPCKRLQYWTESSSPPHEEFHSPTGVTFQDLVDIASSKAVKDLRPRYQCVKFALLDVTIVTDDENKARIDTARRKHERRELVAREKLAVKEIRKGLDKISGFDRSEECDLSALFDENSLES